MRRLLKVTSMTGVLTLFKMVIGFSVAKVIAIYTGPTGIATLGQLQSVITSFNGIINAPVGVGIIKYTASNISKGDRYCALWWRASIQWVMILFILILIPGLIFANLLSGWLFGDPKLYWIVYVIILMLPLTAIGTLFNSIINGQQNYKRYIVLGIISLVCSSIVTLFGIVKYKLIGALFSLSIQTGLIGVVLVIANTDQNWFRWTYFFGALDKNKLKDISHYVTMALVSAIMVPLSLVLVRNILVAKVGWTETGQWQAVWKISEAYLSIITIALSTYFLPRLSSLSGYIKIRKEINQTAILIIPLVFISAVVIYFLRDVIILLLFTKEFSPARNLFAVQLIGDVIKIASWLYAYPMLSHKATKWFVSTEIVFGLSFPLITYLFVTNYGVLGANLGYLINYSIYFLVVFLNTKNFIKEK